MILVSRVCDLATPSCRVDIILKPELCVQSRCFLLKAMAGAASDLIGSRYQPILQIEELTLELNLIQLTRLQGRPDPNTFCSYDFCALSLNFVP